MLSQRHALGLLFLVLAAGFGGIALPPGGAGVWVIALAAAVLGGWMATMSFRLLDAAEQESGSERRILSPWRSPTTRGRSGRQYQADAAIARCATG